MHGTQLHFTNISDLMLLCKNRKFLLKINLQNAITYYEYK